MAKLNELILAHVAKRLLDPARLQEILKGLLRRRLDRTGKEKRVAESKRQASDAEAKLMRLYEPSKTG